MIMVTHLLYHFCFILVIGAQDIDGYYTFSAHVVTLCNSFLLLF